MRFLEEGKNWRLLGLLYVDNMVLCDAQEEDPKTMMGRFVDVCRRMNLKINVDKRKTKVFGEEERSVCEVFVNGTRLEHML